MAKTPKLKKREVSVHSRAARHNASPPPKDLAIKSSVQETEYKPWLHNAQNAGISKKKTKNLTRAQKVRLQRGMEKADANIDKLEKKVADSKKRSKRVQSRRVDWEELNEKLEVNKESRPAPVQKSVAEADGSQMEDVILPDLEQPLSVRSTVAVDGDDSQPPKDSGAPTTQEVEEDEVL